MKPILGTLTVAVAILALAMALAGTRPADTNFDGSFAPPADVSTWGRR